MHASVEINKVLKELYKAYYKYEKQLKKLRYEIGDGSEEDIESSRLVLLWIDTRRNIYLNRFKLAQSYINSIK